MPPRSENTAQTTPVEGYINNIMEVLEPFIEENYAQGKTRAEISTGNLCAEASLNYNTAKKNGVFRKISSRYNSINYERWKGLVVDLEEFVENQEQNVTTEE